MRTNILIIFLLLILTNCSEDKSADNITQDKSTVKKDSVDLWAAIDIKSWDKTPAINGRLATENDVTNGYAVYYIDNKSPDHKPLDIQLPKLAYWTDTDTKKEKLVVVIQIETTPKDTIVGFRNIEGGNAVCLLYELKFLTADVVKTVVGK